MSKTARARKRSELMSQDFDWGDGECVVIEAQSRIAVYSNGNDDLVIRAQDWPDDDHFIVVARNNVAKLIEALVVELGSILGPSRAEPEAMPKPPWTGAERSRRYRQRHANDRDERDGERDALFRDWQKAHAAVNAVSVKMTGIDDRTVEGKERLDAAEAELDECYCRRTDCAELIARTPCTTTAGLLAKLAIVSFYIGEGGESYAPPEGLDIALSVHADAERLLAAG
jgi:hypothetical protein